MYSMGDYNIEPPIQRVVNAVQENFGIPIDAYITTACFDIVRMVDIVGGIPIHLDNEIIYESDKIRSPQATSHSRASRRSGSYASGQSGFRATSVVCRTSAASCPRL